MPYADPAHGAAKKLARYHATRVQAVAIYGGVCAECGSADRLEFDHPDWDGEEHRKTESHQSMYRRIVREGMPVTDRRLRLLCRRCHHERRVGRPSRRLTLAQKWQRELTTLPRSQAAAVIGISPHTVQRWRRELRMAGVVIADRNHPWTVT